MSSLRQGCIVRTVFCLALLSNDLVHEVQGQTWEVGNRSLRKDFSKTSSRRLVTPSCDGRLLCSGMLDSSKEFEVSSCKYGHKEANDDCKFPCGEGRVAMCRCMSKEEAAESNEGRAYKTMGWSFVVFCVGAYLIFTYCRKRRNQSELGTEEDSKQKSQDATESMANVLGKLKVGSKATEDSNVDDNAGKTDTTQENSAESNAMPEKSTSRLDVLHEDSARMVQAKPLRYSVIMRVLLPMVFVFLLPYFLIMIAFGGKGRPIHEDAFTFTSLIGCGSGMLVIVLRFLHRLVKFGGGGFLKVQEGESPVTLGTFVMIDFLLILVVMSVIAFFWGIYVLASPNAFYDLECGDFGDLKG